MVKFFSILKCNFINRKNCKTLANFFHLHKTFNKHQILKNHFVPHKLGRNVISFSRLTKLAKILEPPKPLAKVRKNIFNAKKYLTYRHGGIPLPQRIVYIDPEKNTSREKGRIGAYNLHACKCFQV